MILPLSACLALAAPTWSEPEPAVAPLWLPAGEALRVDHAPGALVEVLVDGAAVAVRGLPTGSLVAAAGSGRWVELRASGEVRVRLVEDRAVSAAWDRWERRSVRASRRGLPVPTAPTGSERDRAGTELRARAGMSPRVLRLGQRADTVDAQPTSDPWARTGPAPTPTGTPTVVEVRGPGLVRVGVRPVTPDGSLARVTARVELDERPVTFEVASTGAAATTRRFAVPPGRHALALDVEGAAAEGSVWETRARSRLGRPIGASERREVDVAESAFLQGDCVEASARYRALADRGGAVAELATARRLVCTDDPVELATLATPDPERSAAGVEVWADAVLARAEELPIEVVAEAVAAAADPDPRKVAAWLDRAVPGTRAAGVALLERTPDVPLGRSSRLDAVRELGLVSRATRLEPLEPGAEVVFGGAPGVPRGRVLPGAPADLAVPAHPDGRAHVVRLLAPGPVAWTFDGVAARSPAGRLDVAASSGAHRLEVTDGELLLLDPELAPEVPRLHERLARTTPATFDLPDPGVSVPFFVDTTSASVLAVFDDGRVERAVTAADGRARFVAGPAATRVVLHAEPGATVSVALRGRGAETAPVEPLPEGTVDELLAAIAADTEAIDAGDVGARVDRCLRLGALGALTTARRDLAVLRESDPDLADHLERRLASRLPTRERPGPATAEAALAAAGRWTPLGGLDPVARAEALSAEPDPTDDLRAAAVDAWLAAGAPVRAAVDALPDDALRARVSATLDWSSLTRVDRSAGLVEVDVGSAPGDEGLGHRVRLALLAAPWPEADALLVADQDHDLVRVRGEGSLTLACRDEGLQGRPCRVPLLVDGRKRTEELADGATLEVPLAGRGAHEVEVTGPGPEHVVSVRLTIDGQVVAPRARRSAVRVTPGAPAAVRVAGAAVLRVDVLDGRVEASAGGRTATAGAGGTIDLPVLDAAPVELVVRGDGTVLLYRGRPAAPDADPPALPPSPPVFAVAPPVVDAVLDHVPVPAAAAPVTPGSLGTWRFSLLGTREVLDAAGTAWSAVGLSGEWMRSRGRPWAAIELRAQGPALATRLAGEVGRRWDTGRAWVAAELAAAPRPELAGHGRLAPAVLQDLRLSHDTRLRGRLVGFAGLWSEEPRDRVDPLAWSTFAAGHPFGVELSASAITTPWRDVRLELGGRATTNPGPSVDRAGPYARAQLLVGGTTVLGLGGVAQWRFADDARTSTTLRPSVDAWLDHAVFTSPDDRVGLRAKLSVVPTVPAVEGEAALTWTLPSGRGLRDLPPDEEPFRALREGP